MPLPRHSSLLLAIYLAGASCLVANADEPPWTHALVTVSSVERQDPPSQQTERIAEIVRELAKAEEESERVRLSAQLRRMEEQVERGTGFIVLGWWQMADRKAQPLSGTCSLAGFFVSDGSAHGALADLQPGAMLLVGRRGLKELFTAGGRRYWQARQVQVLDLPPGQIPPSFPAAPTPGPDPITGLDVSIEFQLVKEPETRPLYRYSLRISVDEPPTDAKTLRLWLRLRATSTRDLALGPVVEFVTIDRSSDGSFSQQRSWEIRPGPDIELDARATTVEVVAVQWLVD